MPFKWKLKSSSALQPLPDNSGSVTGTALTQETGPAPCRCCGSLRTRSLGKLPNARLFAGAQLEHALPGGVLYRCLHCKFVFRHPIFSKSVYDQLYQSGNSTTWEEENRLDQDLVRNALNTFVKQGSILDIGCGTGNLLQPLTGKFAAHGIEINAEAAQLAASRGIRMITGDLDAINNTSQTFDAVIACDVIEHFANPLDFVRSMLTRTKPNGHVIITTGNADAWSWRLTGSRFWYCYLPEHISFVSPNWFRMQAANLGVQVVQSIPFTYSPAFSLINRELRLALMALFRISPTLYYRMLPRIKRNNIPVGRGITRDHFLIVLQKN